MSARCWSWERSTVRQSTEFGGQGIRLGHRAMDLSWVYCWLVTLVHFASASVLAFIILQHAIVETSATASKPGLSPVLQYQIQTAAAKHNKAVPWTETGGCLHTEAQKKFGSQLLPLSHQESIGGVQLHSTFPRLWSAENCLVTWHLLLDFWAVETMNWWYTISFLLSQYHVSIKIIATDTTEAQSVLRSSRKGDLWYKLCVKMESTTRMKSSL